MTDRGRSAEGASDGGLHLCIMTEFLFVDLAARHQHTASTALSRRGQRVSHAHEGGRLYMNIQYINNEYPCTLAVYLYENRIYTYICLYIYTHTRDYGL